MIGEALVSMDRMDAVERIEEMNDKVRESCEKMEEQIGNLKNELAELKVVLYSKFKNSINLEED